MARAAFEADLADWVVSVAEAWGWSLDQALGVTPGQAAALSAAAGRLRRRERRGRRSAWDVSASER